MAARWGADVHGALRLLQEERLRPLVLTGVEGADGRLEQRGVPVLDLEVEVHRLAGTLRRHRISATCAILPGDRPQTGPLRVWGAAREGTWGRGATTSSSTADGPTVEAGAPSATRWSGPAVATEPFSSMDVSSTHYDQYLSYRCSRLQDEGSVARTCAGGSAPGSP